MIRDITLGQYYSVKSPIHNLDGRLKIIATVVYIVALFVVKDFIGFAIAAVGILGVVYLSKVPLKHIMRGMKPILFILFFTFCLNIFMIRGDVIFSVGFLHVTKQGLRTAAFMAIRLILLVIGSSLLTFTTKPIALTDSIEKLLKPLKLIKVSPHDIAMMMSIALRFIPTLLEETDKIMKAQQARGADFESGHLISKVKAIIPILIPLFISAFRIAFDLAMAMEARCYRGGEGRTRMNEIRFGKNDYFAFVICAIFLGVIIAERIML